LNFAGAQLTKTSLNVSESLQSAAQYFNNNDLETADFALRRILRVDPNNADALHVLALVRFRQGKVGESIGFLEQALERRPDDPEFLTNLGNLAKATGDRDAARDWYEKAIKADPESLASYYNLGLLFTEESEFDHAIDVYKRALAINDEWMQLHLNVAIALRAKGDRQAAIENCRSVLKEHPDFLEGNILLGNLYFEEDSPRQALVAYEEAVRIDPENVIALNGVGVCQTSLGDYNAAKKALE
jgi:tetratricopeptide (TPR) repeat protein